MKYACIQRYYDNGKTTAVVVEVEDNCETRPYDRCPQFDMYCDIFDTKKEAEKCKRDTLAA